MRAARSILGLVTLAAMVAACGSTGPTPAPSATAPSASDATPAVTASPKPTAATPTPSATEAPSPSPSAAADVADAFNKTLADPLWSPHITVKAVSTIGAATVAITGTIDVNLGTSHSVVTYGQGRAADTQETIANGSIKYTRQYGAWFKSTDTNSGSLGSLITGSKGFTDSGVEARNGQQLHHMVLPVGTVVPTDSLAVPGRATAVQAAIEGWADGEGNPVVIAVTASWSQPAKSGTVPVTIAMELGIDGAAATISTPTEDDLWAWKTSSVNHYLIAYPSTWEYRKGSAKKADYFYGYDGSFLGVTRYKAQGLSLNSVASYARSHLKTWSGLTNPKLVKVSAGRLNGVAARVLQIKGGFKGTTKYHYDIVAVKNGYVYEVLLSTPRKPTADDLAKWATLLATYKMK